MGYISDVSEIKSVKPAKDVRYVPIQIDPGYPSTSTPNILPVRTASKFRVISERLGDENRNGSSILLKSKANTRVRPAVQAVLDDDDDDEDNEKVCYLLIWKYNVV